MSYRWFSFLLQPPVPRGFLFVQKNPGTITRDLSSLKIAKSNRLYRCYTFDKISFIIL